MTTATASRVEQHSPSECDRRIHQETQARVWDMADRIDAIDQRLKEIDREWDMERALQANAAIVTLATLLLGMRWRKLRLLPAVVAGFLLQHAVQGWCPPVSLLRRMGVRTMREIDRERYALKALRGDFENLPSAADAKTRGEAAMRAASYGDGA